MSKTKICRKTCLKVDLENKSALSIFVSSNMKKNFLRRIFKTQLFLKSLGPYICVTHEILLHQSIGVTLASVEHSDYHNTCQVLDWILSVWCSPNMFFPNITKLHNSLSFFPETLDHFIHAEFFVFATSRQISRCRHTKINGNSLKSKIKRKKFLQLKEKFEELHFWRIIKRF